MINAKLKGFLNTRVETLVRDSVLTLLKDTTVYQLHLCGNSQSIEVVDAGSYSEEVPIYHPDESVKFNTNEYIKEVYINAGNSDSIRFSDWCLHIDYVKNTDSWNLSLKKVANGWEMNPSNSKTLIG